MEPNDWTALRALFDGSVELEGDARRAYLHERCAGDPALRERVERLLAAASEVNSAFLAPGAGSFGAESAEGDGDAHELEGQTVGEYRVVRWLGSGGMGLVFEALHSPSKRRVALKTLRGVHASEDVLRRFRHEFQLLAQLDHPGIARFYDAGVHPSAGRLLPYYTMELVHEGAPLCDHADRARLGERARLRLFAQCAEAVHYGHTKGVIHRDLKPGNVLVDGAGAVKVIDFGLARPLDAAALGVSLVETQEGSLMGTLPYMSPEHLSGRSLAVDVRSDVYSLGCLLWELLSGRPPFVLGDMSLPAAISHLQDTELRADPALPQELRWILGRALEKDPARRYPSASAFAADVTRYCEREPVEAAPPSSWYRFHRMARKNRALIGAALSVIAALSIGLVRANAATKVSDAARLTALEARDDALQQGNTTRAISEFLGSMFHSVDTYALGPEVRVRDLLDLHAPRLEDITDPVARAIARGYLGKGYMHLQDVPRAMDMLSVASRDIAGLLEPTAEARLNVELVWVDLLEQASRYSESIEASQRIAPLVRATFGEESDQYNYVQGNLAVCYVMTGESGLAEGLLRECAARHRKATPVPYEALVIALHRLGQVLGMQGRLAESAAAYDEALAIGVEHLDADSLFLVTVRMDRANGLRIAGRSAEALAELAVVKSEYTRLSANGRNQMQVRLNIAAELSTAGRNAEALVELADADTFSAAFGDGPTTAVLNLATLRAIIAARTGEHALAQEQLDRAVALGRGIFGDKDPNRAMFLHTQAIIHRGRGESDLAADVAREEWALRKSEVGERGIQALVALDWLVRHLLTQKHDNDALALASQLVELTDASDAQLANRQQLLERARARAGQRAVGED